ncbi:hypothetical protein MNL04_07285 [Bartonella krasnovii]|uniref:hypothetical protein n=1 Tax=Bartonella krasnovii TaxID=2267275 RepID=UPI001F4C5D19|nr:hypothetical protein [Bartonella krasnovii]UNF48487.1 hypothetical protein MNL04_07285 [Bartonella krasnovii]
MDSISSKNTSTKKNRYAEKSVSAIMMRKFCHIVRGVFAGIFSVFIFTIFLILFNMRGLVHIVLKFFAGASGFACLFFFFGYLLERREATADEAGISLTLPLAIGEGVFSVCSMYAMWGYDALLFRLAPPGYVLILPE